MVLEGLANTNPIQQSVHRALLVRSICCRTMESNSKGHQCIEYERLCDNNTDCKLCGDDELVSICKHSDYSFDYCYFKFWSGRRQLTSSTIFCDLESPIKSGDKPWSIMWAPHFSLANYSIRPPLNLPSSIQTAALSQSIHQQSDFITVYQQQISSMILNCHRGIPVYLLYCDSQSSLNKNEQRCLCPPTFYGSQCQYQNQRVGVTLKIRTTEWRIPFKFVAYLLDDTEHIVQSYHQINYLSERDCQKKFNFHLLYSSRPFELTTLKYRTTWLFPIKFFFLPVYRLSVQLSLPFSHPSSERRCPFKCKPPNGHCTKYFNTEKFFCRCEPGWSGELCTKSYEHNCSPNSTNVGTWNNKSICVCTLNKFGPRCYLSNNLCQKTGAKKCQNGGQCIARDHRIRADDETICICPDTLFGKECQLNKTQINISFTDIPSSDIPASLLIHFITVRSEANSISWSPAKEWAPHERATTFKKIPFDLEFVSIYWDRPFHLIFAELNHHLYLIFIQTTYVSGALLNISIEPKQRCSTINELFNSTIINFPIFRRVKYYHVPCQQKRELGCFHDRNHFMCLCTSDRRANCFSFDQDVKPSCQQMSYCENGGQCYQDHLTCPTAAICACPTCFFGARCQLSTQGYSIPLDVTLGYRIQPKRSFSHQSLEFLVSIVVTVVMLTAGLINGLFSILTFQRKTPRKVGCGIYLLAASIISLFTMSMFTLKFVSFALIQLLIITNRTVLIGQCICIDFLFKVFLQTGDWLYACVAIERLVNSVRGVLFNKRRSRQVARWVILGVFLIVIGTSIHEPLNRALIDDEEEQRTWCVVRYAQTYSAFLTSYTSVMNIIHLLGPFFINIISTFCLIISTARHRSNAQQKLSYRTHLYNELRQHKNLIISPIGLIILALPRLILTFVIECMKSARDSVTLFLIGYFISFVPPILTFVVFILPSKAYRKECKASMKSLQKMCTRSLCWRQ
jgi:hypothetical protein